MEHGELNHLFQEVFSDAYSLGREVGQGTFSKVYEVKGYDLPAVVKINWVDQAVRENMGATQAEKPAAFRAVKSIYLEHVKNEIRFLEQLRDSGVVTELLDYRIHEQALTHETIAFIVLRQYQSVEQLMELGVRFDEMELIRLGQDICQALILFEAYDILHRDIKPSNIFYEMKEGHRHYLLGDLGIARDQSGHYVVKHGLQGSMTACGSDGYIPPEVQKHETLVGKNWDIYSLGMTLRNLTIGQIAGSWSQVRVSRPMKQIMERATADNPHRRYQRPEIMLRQLRQLKRAYGAGAYQGKTAEQGPDVALHKLPMLALELRWNRGKAVAFCLLLCLVAIGGWYGLARPDGHLDQKAQESVDLVLNDLKSAEQSSETNEILEYQIPKVTGLTRKEGSQILEREGFQTKIKRRYNEYYKKNVILKQKPAAGTRLAENGQVILYVSKGPEPVPETETEKDNSGQEQDMTSQTDKPQDYDVDKAESRAEASRAESRAEASRAESREASKAESREASKAESREASKAESREASKAESREASKAESREASKAESREASKAESREASKTESKAEAKRQQSLEESRRKQSEKDKEKVVHKQVDLNALGEEE